MAALVTYAFDKRRWDPVNTNLKFDDYEKLIDIYGTNNSLELNATQIVNEFFHDKDEDFIGRFYYIENLQLKSYLSLFWNFNRLKFNRVL